MPAQPTLHTRQQLLHAVPVGTGVQCVQRCGHDETRNKNKGFTSRRRQQWLHSCVACFDSLPHLSAECRPQVCVSCVLCRSLCRLHAGPASPCHLAAVASGLVWFGLVWFSRHAAAGGGGGGGAKLWGGRFSGDTDPLMEAFNESLSFDKRLCFVDLEGSRQYAAALHRAGILTADESGTLCTGLDQVEAEWRSGDFHAQPSDEVRGVVVVGVVICGVKTYLWVAAPAPTQPPTPNPPQDIHTANERRLGELVGPVAGKLHTGRRCVLRSVWSPVS